MILSDHTLRSMLATDELHVSPLDDDAIQPASIDCRLGDHFLMVEDKQLSMLSLDAEIIYREFTGDRLILPPHCFVLATTAEFVRLPNNLTAFVEGRSSIGRIGLFIQNAGWVDPGFAGQITLELYNASSLPIELKAGRRICQLVFCQMDRAAENPYNGKYQNQLNATGSRVFLDHEVQS
ncbi:MAG: dCTP deaminase [Rhodothermales bacterium]|jgi:dCTP deaminase